VTVTIYNAVSGEEEAKCGPSVVVPTAARACAFTNSNVLTFCKVNTSSGANTRATHSIWTVGPEAVSSTPVR
jgi:hypothetical protein